MCLLLYILWYIMCDRWLMVWFFYFSLIVHQSLTFTAQFSRTWYYRNHNNDKGTSHYLSKQVYMGNQNHKIHPQLAASIYYRCDFPLFWKVARQHKMLPMHMDSCILHMDVEFLYPLALLFTFNNIINFLINISAKMLTSTSIEITWMMIF